MKADKPKANAIQLYATFANDKRKFVFLCSNDRECVYQFRDPPQAMTCKFWKAAECTSQVAKQNALFLLQQEIEKERETTLSQ